MSATFTTKSTDDRRAEAAANWATADEAMSRCAAAARLATQSKNYSHEDRADMAAELLARIWADAAEAGLTGSMPAILRTSLAGPPVVYSKYNAQKSQDERPVWGQRAALRRDALPAFGVIYGRACNLRRSLDRLRAHDAADAARAAGDAFAPISLEDSDPETRGTVEGAHEAARSMLGSLGLSRLGKCYPAAYAAARVASGWDIADIATEIGAPSAEAAWKNVRRAAARIPSGATHSAAAHADLLGLDGGRALKPAKSRNEAGSMSQEPRTKPDTDAPVTTRQIAPAPRRGADDRPSWTRTLSPATAARLLHASELKRADAEAAAADGDDAPPTC